MAKFAVVCPTCEATRYVGRVQLWRLEKGYRKECKSCAETGNAKRLGTAQPDSFKLAKSEAMRGNQHAKGHERPSELVEADRIRMVGNKLRTGIKGELVGNWKGNEVGYFALHHWVNREYGQPDTCEHCGKTGLAGRKIQWANKSGEYVRNRSDWLRLCVPCHKHYDIENGIAIHPRFLATAGKRG